MKEYKYILLHGAIGVGFLLGWLVVNHALARLHRQDPAAASTVSVNDTMEPEAERLEPNAAGERSMSERVRQDRRRVRELEEQAENLLEEADLLEYENDTFHDLRCKPMREEAKKLLAEAKQLEKKIDKRGILCGWAGNSTIYTRIVYSEETCAILGLERVEVK
jgi:hypothetical protein